MKKQTLEALQKFSRPYIAIIGATMPRDRYLPEKGEYLGYVLRARLENKSGSLFTGGVEGVGVDAYRGISLFCASHKTKEDKFFVLAPERVQYLKRLPQGTPILEETEPEIEDSIYEIPVQYRNIARKIRKDIIVLQEGNSFEERRKHLAELGDLFVMVNGSNGTLDEALTALRLGKRVVVVANTGGMAEAVADTKLGLLPKFPKKLFHPLYDIIHPERFNETLRLVDSQNVQIVQDAQDIII